MQTRGERIAGEAQRRMAASTDLSARIEHGLTGVATVLGVGALAGPEAAPFAIGALQSVEESAQGTPAAEALAHGALTIGAMGTAGELADSYAARFTNPYAKTLASTAAYETAFRGSRAIEEGATGKQGPPDTPIQVAFDFLQNLGFGRMHARGMVEADKAENVRKIIQGITDHPDVHPEVKGALEDALAGQINPSAAGNVRASNLPREPIRNRVVVRSEDGRLGVIQIGRNGSAQFNEVTNPQSQRAWSGAPSIAIQPEEFETVFPRQAQGYQPGSIEAARAQFIKDEGLVPQPQRRGPSVVHTPLSDLVAPETIQAEVGREIAQKRAVQQQAQAAQQRAQARVTVPESPRTITDQIAALRSGRRQAVLLTPGEGINTASLAKQGFQVTRTDIGTFIHPDTISPERIVRSVKDGSYHKLLGHVAVKPAAGQPAVTVVARHPEGHELQASVVPPDQEEAQRQAFQAQYPDATVSTEDPRQVISERLDQGVEQVRSGQREAFYVASPETTRSNLPVDKGALENQGLAVTRTDQGWFVHQTRRLPRGRLREQVKAGKVASPTAPPAAEPASVAAFITRPVAQGLADLGYPRDVVAKMRPADAQEILANNRRYAAPDAAKPTTYDYSSTQVNLPDSLANRVKAVARKIPDSELGGDGREDQIHATVKYGLHGEDPGAVRALLADEGPITVTLGKLKVFEGVENGKVDAIVAEVDSPDLHRLNKKISDALPHTDTFPDYRPHVTLAYVKPGEGEKYVGRSDLEGQTTTLDHITFSGKSGEQVDIPLTGKGVPTSKAPRLEDSKSATRQFPSGLGIKLGDNVINPEGKGRIFTGYDARGNARLEHPDTGAIETIKAGTPEMAAFQERYSQLGEREVIPPELEREIGLQRRMEAERAAETAEPARQKKVGYKKGEKPPQAPETRRFVVRGDVQGTGFRNFAEAEGGKLGLDVEAHNLDDGSVEVIAHGDDSQHAELLKILEQGPEAARVDSVESRPAESTQRQPSQAAAFDKSPLRPNERASLAELGYTKRILGRMRPEEARERVYRNETYSDWRAARDAKKAADDRAYRNKQKDVATAIKEAGGIRPSEGTAEELRHAQEDLRRPGLINKDGKNGAVIADHLASQGYRMPDGRLPEDEMDIVELLDRQAQGLPVHSLDYDWDAELDKQLAEMDEGEARPVVTMREAFKKDDDFAWSYVKLGGTDVTEADEKDFIERARYEHGFDDQEIQRWINYARAERGAPVDAEVGQETPTGKRTGTAVQDVGRPPIENLAAFEQNIDSMETARNHQAGKDFSSQIQWEAERGRVLQKRHPGNRIHKPFAKPEAGDEYYPNLRVDSEREAFNSVVERLGGVALTEDEGGVGDQDDYLKNLTPSERAAYYRALYLWHHLAVSDSSLTRQQARRKTLDRVNNRLDKLDSIAGMLGVEHTAGAVEESGTADHHSHYQPRTDEGQFDGPPQYTGISHAAVRAERASRREPALARQLRQAVGESYDKGQAMLGDNPEIFRRQAAEWAENPRPLSTEENAALLIDRARIRNERRDTEQAIGKAIAAGDRDQAESLRVELARLMDHQRANDQAAWLSGSEAGRAFRFRQQMVNEDYTFAQMERELRLAGGEELTEQQRVDLQDLEKRIEQRREELERIEAQAVERATAQALRIEQAEVKREARKTVRKKDRGGLDDEFSSLTADLKKAHRESGVHASWFAAIDPEGKLTPIVAKMVRNRVRAGINTVSGLTDSIFNSLKDNIEGLTRRDVMEAVSGWGAPKVETRNDLASEIHRVKSLTTLALKLEDIGKGLEPEKAARVQADPEVIRARAEVARAMKEAGMGQYSSEAELERALKSTQASIDDLEGRIQRGQIQPKNQKTSEPWSVELGKRKQRLAALREEMQELRNSAKGPKDPNAAKLRAFIRFTEKRTGELRARIASGDYSDTPERPRLVLDQAAMDARANYERTKQEFDTLKYKAEMANRSIGEKVILGAAKVGRQVMISGVTTAEKLSGFGLVQQFVIPLQDLVGEGWRHVPLVSRAAARAPREGAGFNVRAQAQGLTEYFVTWAGLAKKGSQERVYFKTGKADIDVLYGKHGGRDLPPEVTELIGIFHGMEKLPVRLGEFKRSMVYLLEAAAKNGQDISDPAVVFTAGAGAYQNANRAALLQDNVVTSLFSRLKGTARQMGYRKTAAAMEFAVPIAKIPVNFVAEMGRYSGGGVAKALPEILYRGLRGTLDQLPPDRADQLMRNLKKGTVGPMLGLVAYLFPQVIQVAGYKAQKEKESDLDMKPGTARIFGVEIPKPWIHSPPAEAMQVYSTLARLHEKMGWGGAALVAAKEEAKHIPFLELPAAIAGALDSDTKLRTFVTDMIKSRVIPPDLQRGARIWDQPGVSGGEKTKEFFGLKPEGTPTARKSSGSFLQAAGQDIEQAIPGARETVMAKSPQLSGPVMKEIHAVGLEVLRPKRRKEETDESFQARFKADEPALDRGLASVMRMKEWRTWDKTQRHAALKWAVADIRRRITESVTSDQEEIAKERQRLEAEPGHARMAAAITKAEVGVDPDASDDQIDETSPGADRLHKAQRQIHRAERSLRVGQSRGFRPRRLLQDAPPQ